MGITRTPMPFERDYVQIPNAWLRDDQLSRRARGLLAELMTHRVGWHITIASLQKAGPEGRDAIRGAVIELAERGYLTRRQTQGASGRFNEIEYEITDPTAVGKPDTGGFTDDGSADDGSADVGGSAPKNTSQQKTITEEHRSGEKTLSPFCSQHPDGTESPCGPCGTARVRFERQQTVQDARWANELARLSTVEKACAAGNHRWLADGTCLHCTERREHVGVAA